MEDWYDDVPDHWGEREEVLPPQPLDWKEIVGRSSGVNSQPTGWKVGRPMKITNWFGVDSTSSSEKSEEEMNSEWNSVDRKRKSEEKRSSATTSKYQDTDCRK